MTLSIKLNATPDLPSSVPVMSAIAPDWNTQRAADLAARLDVSGDVDDAGLWYVVRDDRATVEIYQASHSFRYSHQNLDGEARNGSYGAPSEDDALTVTRAWLEPHRPEEAEPRITSVVEREILVAARTEPQPRRLVAGLEVNVSFTVNDFLLVGPGAKAKVLVGREGVTPEGYLFWREVLITGERKTRPLDNVFERLADSDLFRGLSDDDARAEVNFVQFGYLSIAPTEPMPALTPVLEFRGRLETAFHSHDFVRYVAAVDPDGSAPRNKLGAQLSPLVIA